MSIIAEFTVPADEFALYRTLCEVPETVVEVERVVAHDEGHLVPYFWVSGEDYAEFEQRAEDDPSIEEITKLDEVEGANLYRAEWVHDVETVAYAMTNTGATLLNATGHDGRWSMELRFDTREGLSTFHTYLQENEVNADLQRLYEPSQPRVDGQPGLTDIQHETLVTALNEGYYNMPRDITMDELAAQFGVSQPALSKRLRNGHRTLIANSLMVQPPDTVPDQ
jgi:predicted DNA binding protein